MKTCPNPSVSIRTLVNSEEGLKSITKEYISDLSPIDSHMLLCALKDTTKGRDLLASNLDVAKAFVQPAIDKEATDPQYKDNAIILAHALNNTPKGRTLLRSNPDLVELLSTNNKEAGEIVGKFSHIKQLEGSIRPNPGRSLQL